MGHLLPKIPGCPTHRVKDLVVLDHMAPAAGTTFRTKQFFQPFIAQHQHGVSVDDQVGFFGLDAPLPQLFGLQQMQVVLLPLA